MAGLRNARAKGARLVPRVLVTAGKAERQPARVSDCAALLAGELW